MPTPQRATNLVRRQRCWRGLSIVAVMQICAGRIPFPMAGLLFLPSWFAER
jgi:hypothetical protein